MTRTADILRDREVRPALREYERTHGFWLRDRRDPEVSNDEVQTRWRNVEMRAVELAGAVRRWAAARRKDKGRKRA